MRIDKPWRILLQSATAAALMGIASVVGTRWAPAPWHWVSLIPLCLLVYLFIGFLVDSLDLWLRRVTRDR